MQQRGKLICIHETKDVEEANRLISEKKCSVREIFPSNGGALYILTEWEYYDDDSLRFTSTNTLS